MPDKIEFLTYERLAAAYAKSTSRLFLFDYVGTLVDRVRPSNDYVPDDELNQVIFALTSDTANEVVIISELPRTNVAGFFAHLPVVLAAEHGAWLRVNAGEWRAVIEPPPSWIVPVGLAIQRLTSRYPGTTATIADFSATWNFGNSDHAIPQSELNQMSSALHAVYSRQNVVIELKPRRIIFRSPNNSKGRFVATWAANARPFDFVLVAGDGEADEGVFDAVGSQHFTVKIGSSATKAKYVIPDTHSLRTLMKQILTKSHSGIL